MSVIGRCLCLHILTYVLSSYLREAFALFWERVGSEKRGFFTTVVSISHLLSLTFARKGKITL